MNRSPEALKAQVAEIFDQNPKRVNVHSGSFSSVEAANKLVNSTLAQNRDTVDQVAAVLRRDAVVYGQFNSVTGVEAVGPNIRSEIYFRETYAVGVRTCMIRIHRAATSFSPPSRATIGSSMPNSERFEITCYHAWAGAEATYRFASKEEYEAVRRALDDMTFSRFGGRCEVFGLSSPPTDYYVIDEPDRDAFNEIMRGKGIGPDEV